MFMFMFWVVMASLFVCVRRLYLWHRTDPLPTNTSKWQIYLILVYKFFVLTYLLCSCSASGDANEGATGAANEGATASDIGGGRPPIGRGRGRGRRRARAGGRLAAWFGL
jgi:hypothetical protein